MKYITTINDQEYEIEILSDDMILVNGKEHQVNFRSMGAHGIFSILLDNQSYEAVVEKRDGNYHVLMFGDLYEINVSDEREKRLAEATGNMGAVAGDASIKSPMPGLIVAVLVNAGEEVVQGQTIVILESMKMENELKTSRNGVVQSIHVKKGDTVEQNKVLVTIH